MARDKVGLISLMNTLARSSIRLFSPHNRISKVPIRQVQAALITRFKNWGVPAWIRVDNGRPFGDPQREVIPVLALWLIALDIKVIWNRPRHPQANAKVERSQGVLDRWIDPAKCEDTFDLQVRLYEQAEFHNYHFPIRRLGGQKRIEAFPSLPYSGRSWNPGNFKLQRVLDFLSQGSWERKVSTNGQIILYGQRLSAGMKYKHQWVSIRLCPQKNQWNVFDASGTLIKTFHTPFSKEAIWALDLSVTQRT